MLKSRYAVIDVLGIEKTTLVYLAVSGGISVILCGQPLVGGCSFSVLNITLLAAGRKRVYFVKILKLSSISIKSWTIDKSMRSGDLKFRIRLEIPLLQ